MASDSQRPVTFAWTPMLYAEHWEIDRDPARSFVRIHRTSVPSGSIEAMIPEIERMGAALKAIDRRTHVALVDLRDGPFRNDPEFEERIRPAQAQLLFGFRRVAMLVRTAVGMLQMARTQREAADGAFAYFQDESKALEFLFKP